MNKTLKSTLLGTASVALMVAASSETKVSAQTTFDGFYAGAQVGYHSFNAKETSRIRSESSQLVEGSSFNTLNDGDSNSNRAFSGISGGVFGGYGRTFSRFYVGAELDAGYSGARSNQQSSFFGVSGVEGTLAFPSGLQRTSSLRAKESYGASLRLGYLISDGALLYSRFGFQRTRFQLKSSVESGLGPLSGANLINQSKTFNGMRFGLGAQIMLSSLFGPTVNMGKSFVRLDWSHTWYQSKTFTGSSSQVSGSFSATASESTRVKPTENRFMFGIGVQF